MDLHSPIGASFDAESVGGAQSVGRALALLRTLGAQGQTGASLSALVAHSGLTKPTCRRLLMALMGEGFVEQDTATRTYHLGREAYFLGMVAATRHGLHRPALEAVERLAQTTGDAAFLQVRQGDYVVCLARQDGDWPLRSHVLRPGDRHLVGAGAGGLAFLAAMPDAEAAAFLAAEGEALRQRYPLLAPQLPALIEETRQRGYSMNRGAIFPGSWGMGMVVRDAAGRPEACLSLAAVESRMQPDREPELAALLTKEVRRLEAAARHKPARPPAETPALPPSSPLKRTA